MSADFYAFAAERGLVIRNLESGRWVRVPTVTHPRKRNGSYFFAGEYGFVQDWAHMECVDVWQDKKERSPFEKTELLKRISESQKAYSAQRSKAHHAASIKAVQLLRDATLQDHAYLHNKGFPDTHGFVDDAGRLLVPMKDCLSDELRGVQSIEWLSDERVFKKKMQSGMKAKGAIFRIGNKTAFEAFLVEGYATGLSVFMALKQLRLNASVVCCFSDSNLVHVAGQLKGKKYVFADHDESKAGEKAAIKSGLNYCLSEISGEDANDLHKRAGIMAVCKKIMEVRRS